MSYVRWSIFALADLSWLLDQVTCRSNKLTFGKTMTDICTQNDPGWKTFWKKGHITVILS